jgi:hypothetical protein
MTVLAIILSLFCFLVTGPMLVMVTFKYRDLLIQLSFLEGALTSIRQNHSTLAQSVATLKLAPTLQEERLQVLERKIAAFQLMR